MTRIVLDLSVSLDGYAAGPNVGVAEPMGEGGERLHDWHRADGERDAAGVMFARAGAVVLGRRTFDLGIELWGDDGTFGMPSFVVTHRARAPLQKGPTRFEFVTDGVAAAIERARAAAGAKDVWLMGGADIARQALHAGLVDELRVHLVPVLLGAGSRPFDGAGALRLSGIDAVESAPVLHLGFRIGG
jgi:dihydrofolate reductase